MKKYIKYYLIILLIIILIDILLYQNADKSIMLIIYSQIFSLVLAGESNAINATALGFGKTRKEIEKELVHSLLLIIIVTCSLIVLDIGFIYLMNQTLSYDLRYIIFSYLTALTIGLIILFLKRNFQNVKAFSFSIILLLMVLLIIIFIDNVIIINILLCVFLITLYLLGHYSIHKKEIK